MNVTGPSTCECTLSCSLLYVYRPHSRLFTQPLYQHVAEGDLSLAPRSAPAPLPSEAAALHHYYTNESGASAVPQGNGACNCFKCWLAIDIERNRALHASPYGPLSDTLPPMYAGMPNMGHVASPPFLQGTSAWTSSPPSLFPQQYHATARGLSPAQARLPYMIVPPPSSTVLDTALRSREGSFSGLSIEEDASGPTPSQALATFTRGTRAAFPSPYSVSSSASSSASSTAPSSPSPRAHNQPRSRPSSSHSSSSASDGLQLKCPQCNCIVGRPQELCRHMKKHAPKEGEPRWPCCGVPLADAAERGVPAGGTPFDYNGMRFVGGCGKPYSRRDALARHLKRKGKGKERLCHGDPYGWYLRGNQETW